MTRITMTYTVTTPESAANGDWEDSGFYEPGGWFHSINGDDSAQVVKRAQNGDYDLSNYTLSEVVKVCQDYGLVRMEKGGNTMESPDPIRDRKYFEEGAETYITLHVNDDNAAAREAVLTLLENNWEGLE